MRNDDKHVRYNAVVTPHLGAAYNLARWLTGSDQDAEDVVQEACLRAFKFVDGFRGEDGRAWLLAIVRNTCYTSLRQNRRQGFTTSFEPELHDVPDENYNPEVLALRHLDLNLAREALRNLPLEFREIVVLREMEGLSYKEIGRISGLPAGTVMSRLARARRKLQAYLAPHLEAVEGGDS